MWDFHPNFDYWHWCVEDTTTASGPYDLTDEFVTGSFDLGLGQNDGFGGLSFTLGPVPGPDEAPSGIISADWHWEPSPGTPIPDGFPRYVNHLDPSGDGCSGDYCVQWPYSYAVYTASLAHGLSVELDAYEADVFVQPVITLGAGAVGGGLRTGSGHFEVPVPHGHIYDYNLSVQMWAMGEGNTSVLSLGVPVVKCTQCMTAFSSGGFSVPAHTFTLPAFTSDFWEVEKNCGVTVSLDDTTFTATANSSSGEAHALVKMKDNVNVHTAACENILTGFDVTTVAIGGTGTLSCIPGFKVIGGTRDGQYGVTGALNLAATIPASAIPMNIADALIGVPDSNSQFGPNPTYASLFFAIDFSGSAAVSGSRSVTVGNVISQGVIAANT